MRPCAGTATLMSVRMLRGSLILRYMPVSPQISVKYKKWT